MGAERSSDSSGSVGERKFAIHLLLVKEKVVPQTSGGPDEDYSSSPCPLLYKERGRVLSSCLMTSELIQATYRITSEKPLDVEKKAKAVALGQTTDTWTPTQRSGLLKLKEHTAVVLKTREISPSAPPHHYEITIGFPPANTEGDIPSLLTMLFGKISMDGEIRLEAVEFPERYLHGKGPRHGIEGVRKKVAEKTHPLLMAIFKPCVGLSPKELAAMFYELALGGMHLVKDDEILPDLSICPTEKRLETCLRAADRAQEKTGRRTLYAVNLTGRASQLASKARRLARQGAECFLLNVLSYGYGVLEELREVGVPIMAHPALAGAWCGISETGISYSVVLGSLMRLGGADMVLFPSSYGTVTLSYQDTARIRQTLISPHESLKRSFPVPSAGIHPGLVPRILEDYGEDVIINAGGGVHGHPDGPRAGARAFQQALQQLSEKDAPELAKAVALWGKG